MSYYKFFVRALRPEIRRPLFRSRRFACAATIVIGIAISSVGCASTSMDHMAVTNYADRTLVPDNQAAQWALTPLLIPLTVVTLAIDNFIVAPVVHVPSAGTDASAFFDQRVEGYYSRMAITPFQVLLTPVVFVSSWIGRSFFAVETDHEALWSWPAWGRQWQRDDAGRLLGPPPETEMNPSEKMLEPPHSEDIEARTEKGATP